MMSGNGSVDSVRKILLEKLRKVLLPDFTNRLTWLIGGTGVALIAGPGVFHLVAKVSTVAFGVPIEFELLSEDRSGWGILLCVLAVGQNIAYQFKGLLSEVSAIKAIERSDRKEALAAIHEHERFLKLADSNIAIETAKRKHDLQCMENITAIFPFETSCRELIVAPDLGISFELQDSLEDLANMHDVTYRFYDEEVESIRYDFIKQANLTQSVLSSKLSADSRFPGKYVPFYEQKHNGLKKIFWTSNHEMREACEALIKSYKTLVLVLQRKNLWGLEV